MPIQVAPQQKRSSILIYFTQCPSCRAAPPTVSAPEGHGRLYGVPLFFKENGGGRAHGNDERISLANLDSGAELLWRIVLEIAAVEDFRAQ